MPRRSSSCSVCRARRLRHHVLEPGGCQSRGQKEKPKTYRGRPAEVRQPASQKVVQYSFYRWKSALSSYLSRPSLFRMSSAAHLQAKRAKERGSKRAGPWGGSVRVVEVCDVVCAGDPEQNVMCVCGGVRRVGARSCTSMWWMGVVAGWRARLECSERVWSWWVLKLCRAVQALYRKEYSRRSASFACADDAVGPRVRVPATSLAVS